MDAVLRSLVLKRFRSVAAEEVPFDDAYRRAANLHLEPDLNVGVVLNIAPRHELVPWKVAKDYL